MLNVSALAARHGLLAMGLFVLACGPAAAYPQGSLDDSSVVVLVGGDVLPQSPHRVIPNAAHMFDGVRDEFSRADLVFVNLEEPITRSTQVTPHKNPAEIQAGRDYILRARDASLPSAFKQAGVGLIGLANNHILDYTVTGLEDTLRGLRQAELPVVGAGFKAEAERAFVLRKNGVRVALLAFCDVVPPHSQATKHHPGIASSKPLMNLTNAIRGAHQEANFVVLMIHWGGQGSHLITKRQQEVAQAAAQAGCDVIIGMHPHVLQGIEYMGRVPVFYSLGNFAYPSTSEINSECILVRLTFGTKELESVDLVPVRISRAGVPKAVAGARGERIFAHLDQLCRMFNTQIEAGRIAASPVRATLVFDESTPPARRNRRANGRARRVPSP